MKKIGIIGCGAMGVSIAEFIYKKMKHKAKVSAVCDIDGKKAVDLSKKIKPNPKVLDIGGLIKISDMVIESAGIKAATEAAEKAVLYKKDIIIMSTGGLLKKASLLKKARQRGCNIYIPSGAVCGLDGLISAGMGKIKKVSLTTRKPPEGLNQTGIKKETILYKGNAEGAIKLFPKNINVAATLSLLGIGPKRTIVKIISSPEYKRNIHEVEIEGEFGRLWTRAENVPAKANPKTSQLAIFSVLSKLKEVV